ncbi:MAG: hypothetical protein IH898_09180, partial [Planctomycetes bacterium]|nr:hypothetical protein [Planctomycetota bacterium]
MQSIESLALKILLDSSLGPYSNTASSSTMVSSTTFEQKEAPRSFAEEETEEEYEDGDEDVEDGDEDEYEYENEY